MACIDQPSPASSAHKLTVATVRDIPLSDETVRHLGVPVPMEAMVRFPTDQGGEIYSELEFKHQLHCLVLTRDMQPENV